MLIYVGSGKFIPTIPARDLSEDEVKQFGGIEFLLSTGLYRRPGKKELLGGAENKVVQGSSEVKHG